MKLVCEQCGAKYSIADDKVKGKSFKIRCKRCQNPIVVNADGGMAYGSQHAGAGDYAGQDQAVGEQVWYVAVGEEQVGPVDVQQIQGEYAAGNINDDNYVWREGMADWLRLGDVPEIAAYMGGGGPEMGAYDVQYEQELSDYDDLDAQDDYSAQSYGGDDPSASSDSFFPSVADTSGDELVGARNENSVLFSLSNLQDLGASRPRKKDRPSTGTSGLIDLRALAASEDGGGDVELDGGGVKPVITSSIYMPVAKGGGSGTVVKVILGMSLGLLLAIGGVLIWLLSSRAPVMPQYADSTRPGVAAPGAPPAGAEGQAGALPVDQEGDKDGADQEAADEGEGDDSASTGVADAKKAGDQPAKKAAAPAAPADKKASDTAKTAAAPKKVTPSEPVATRKAAPDTAAQQRGGRGRAPAASSKDDSDISSLLDGLGQDSAPSAPVASRQPVQSDRRRGAAAQQQPAGGRAPAARGAAPARGGAQAARPAAAAGGGAAKASLSRDDIRNVVARNRNNVRRCYQAQAEPRKSGSVTVRFVINSNGSVGSAQITGGPVTANEPVGKCVLSTVRRMRFPAFNGDPLTISFPFVLN